MGKNPDGRFVLSVETIELRPLLQQCAAFMQAARDVAVGPPAGADSSTACPSSVRLIESHGDCVMALPPGAILLAESSTAAVEMWTMPGGNIVGVQASLQRGRVSLPAPQFSCWPSLHTASLRTLLHAC